MMWSLLTQLDTQIDVPSDTAYFFPSGREMPLQRTSVDI
jgi:hypothetical protein